jgi:hypothetical protein
MKPLDLAVRAAFLAEVRRRGVAAGGGGLGLREAIGRQRRPRRAAGQWVSVRRACARRRPQGLPITIPSSAAWRGRRRPGDLRFFLNPSLPVFCHTPNNGPITFSDALRLFQNHPHITLRQSSEALAKPPSSVLQAQVSEASIQNWNALTESILRLKVWK